jgi:hypothetical protein
MGEGWLVGSGGARVEYVLRRRRPLTDEAKVTAVACAFEVGNVDCKAVW